MKYLSHILFLILALCFLTGCSNNRRLPDDNMGVMVESSDNKEDTASHSTYTYPLHHLFNEGHNIYDGEADHSHNLSPDELHYHAKRGVSTLEDAYLEGYEDGYEDGEEDSSGGKRHGHSYDPDSDFTGKFEDSYNDGYEDGYNDGYYSSLTNDYEDNDDD